MSRRVTLTAAEAKQIMMLLADQLEQQADLFHTAVVKGEEILKDMKESMKRENDMLASAGKTNKINSELLKTLKSRDAQIEYLTKENTELKNKSPLQRILGG